MTLATQTHGTAKAFLAAGAFWFLAGTVFGLIAAIHLVAPEFFNNVPFLVFGRTRPVHVNTVIFGFTASTLIGCAYYYVPALLRTPLWSERLGWVSWFSWNLTVLSGFFTFPFGFTQGREYAEYLWIFDVSLVVAMLAMIVNFTMTVATRIENVLYVSVWYALGACLWSAANYPIGNVMWHPLTGALPGLLDSVFLWFYGHNLVGMLLTPLSIAVVYYVVPRVARTPLYSHTLSLIGFWTLVSMYAHIGGHHILQAPIPNWLKTISVVDSVAMIVPVFTVLVNVWLTARGHGARLWRDPAARFIMAGTAWYLVTCIQGPLQSLPSIQKVTHFTNWTIGHAHIAVLGFSGMIALGGLWHILPLVTGRPLHSPRLVNLQFALLTFGLAGFFAVLTAAGLIQGEAWHNGETVYRVLPEIAVYMALRAMFGVSILAASAIGLYVAIMSLRPAPGSVPATSCGTSLHPAPNSVPATSCGGTPKSSCTATVPDQEAAP